MDKDNQLPHQQISFRAHWNTNPYEEPKIVNQMLMAEGVSTTFGNDGIVYLTLGHVSMPSFNPDMPTNEAGEVILQVNTVGYFGMTIERAAELRDLLSKIVSDVAERRESERNDSAS